MIHKAPVALHCLKHVASIAKKQPVGDRDYNVIDKGKLKEEHSPLLNVTALFVWPDIILVPVLDLSDFGLQALFGRHEDRHEQGNGGDVVAPDWEIIESREIVKEYFAS